MTQEQFFVTVRGKKIALTKLHSWRKWSASGKQESQEFQALVFLNTVESATSRQIATALGVERTSITRTIANLQMKKEIKILKIGKCPTTKRQVNWYCILPPQEQQKPEKKEEKPNRVEVAQSSLFDNSDIENRKGSGSFLANW